MKKSRRLSGRDSRSGAWNCLVWRVVVDRETESARVVISGRSLARGACFCFKLPAVSEQQKVEPSARYFRPCRNCCFASTSVAPFTCESSCQAPNALDQNRGMDSSTRIFVKGLPPKFSEAELRKHFSQNGRAITDIKYFPDRRFGYVGFKTPEDAQAVVKYFNRTYVRMSRIGVELARPIEERAPPPTARRGTVHATEAPPALAKRKRESEATDKQDDPKLKEFLEAYKSKSKKKEAEDALMQDVGDGAVHEEATVEIPTAESDDEYEQVPKKARHAKVDAPKVDETLSTALPTAEEVSKEINDQNESPAVEGAAPVSDADWARSRTSRLLGLLDDEEEEAVHSRPSGTDDEDEGEETITKSSKPVEEPVSSIPTPPADDNSNQQDEATAAEPVDADVEAVRKSMRLFVRNLPYDARKEDLETEFERFGNLEEVSKHFFHLFPTTPFT